MVAPIPVNDQISDGLWWRVVDRFGTTTGEHMLAEAQDAILCLVETQEWTLDGWVQKASRSVVATVNNGEYIVKAPLFDAAAVSAAIRLYSEHGTGAHVIQHWTTPHVVIAMSRLDGLFFDHPEQTDLFDLRDVVQTIRRAQPATLDNTPYMTLTERLDVELAEAALRAHRNQDEHSLSVPYQLAQHIVEYTQHSPLLLCHGDVDLRNALHEDGEMRLIDPEPLIAPIEWEFAKLAMSTKRDPEEVASFFDGDTELTGMIHAFMVLVSDIYLRNRQSDPRAMHIQFTVK